MARRTAPRSSSLSPRRSASELLFGQRALASALFSTLLALAGCQYVSGAADLKVEEKSPTGMTEAGTSGQSGAGGGGTGGAGGGASGATTGGGTGDPDPWGCVGKPLGDPGSGDFTTSGTVLELNTRSPVLNTSVSACRATDADCMKPIATDYSEDGTFSLLIPQSFQGYFRVEPPPTFVPAIVQMTLPIGIVRGNPEIVLFETGTLNSLAGILRTTIDPSAGHAFFSIADCDGKPARDISVTVSSMNAGSYSEYYLADNSIPTTGRDFTGQQGGGGFVNLSPGLATFQVVKFDDGLQIATVGAPIKAGYTTFFQVQPH
jgi:hypothetical protein